MYPSTKQSLERCVDERGCFMQKGSLFTHVGVVRSLDGRCS